MFKPLTDYVIDVPYRLITSLIGTILLLPGLMSFSGPVVAEHSREHSRPGALASPVGLQVKRSGEFFTVTARNVVMSDVLREVARQGGVVLMLQDPLEQPVTLQLKGLSLHETLCRILRNRSFILLLDQAGQNNILQVLSGEEDDDIPPYLNRMSMDTDEQVSLHAVSTLTTLDNEQARAAFAVILNNKEVAVREEAVELLADIGGQLAIPLLEQALKDPEMRVREAAIAAFGDVGGEDSARALTAALYDKEDALREQAVDALGDIGGPTAVQLLEQALADPKASIREAAAESLADLRNQ